MVDRKELFLKWKIKLTVSEDDLENEYQKFFSEYQNANLNIEQKEHYILSRMQSRYKRQFMSNAKSYEGIIIGFGGKIDYVRKARQFALEQYEKDPQRAVESGLVNEEGIPIYQSPDWKRGQIMPLNDYGRNIFLLASLENSNEQLSTYVMNVRNELVDNLPPLFKKVKFRCNPSKTPNMLNSTSVTKFEITGDIEFTRILELLGSYKVNIKNLKDWAIQHQDDFNRFCIVKANVMSLSPTPTEYGTIIMSIDDLEAGFDDPATLAGITCWVPSEIPIEFGENSVVYVIGSPSYRNDPERGEQVSINVYGLKADPKFIVKPENAPKPVTSDNVESW